jgi:hypothetical protein
MYGQLKVVFARFRFARLEIDSAEQVVRIMALGLQLENAVSTGLSLRQIF